MIAPGFPEGCVASPGGAKDAVLLLFPVGVSSGVDAGNAYYCCLSLLCALRVRVSRAALCVATGDDSVGAGAAGGRKGTGHTQVRVPACSLVMAGGDRVARGSAAFQDPVLVWSLLQRCQWPCRDRNRNTGAHSKLLAPAARSSCEFVSLLFHRRMDRVCRCRVNFCP